jgi:hypothetical protein
VRPTAAMTSQNEHQAAIDNADVIRPVKAALIAPERTTAIRTAAKAQAASVPTAYSAVVIPTSAFARMDRHRVMNERLIESPCY